MTDPVRYGILGAANIARSFTRGIAGSALASIEAVASRGAEKAAAFAAELSIPRHHASYEALLSDPAIEAIYIPLPNDLHAEWAIKAAQAGKHVLCEKPLAVGERDAKAMFDAARANGVHLAEAYPYMSQPQTLRTRALLAEGTVGQVQTITSAFGFGIVSSDGAPLGDPTNIRLLPDRAGGALMDAGTYAMSMARIAAGVRPTRVFAIARWTQGGVDQTVAALVEFPSGAIAQVSTSMSTSFHRSATIVGTSGVIETGYANHAPDGTLTLRVKRGVPGTIPFETEEIAGADGFRLEAESFARLVRTGTGWDGATEAESLDTAAALAAIAASMTSGEWVDLPVAGLPAAA
jgi:xylose dehydrogenase (NAD/NADP)